MRPVVLWKQLRGVDTDCWLALGLLALALLARLLVLDCTPNTVSADELDFGWNALSVISGQGPGLFGLDWTPEPALSMYVIAACFRLFGASVLTLRLGPALITALAVVPLYALLRRQTGRPAAVTAAGLCSTCSWFLTFSRSAWNNGEVVTVLLVAAWALVRVKESGRLRYWLIFGAMQALLLYGYFAGRTVVLAFALYLAGSWLWARGPARRQVFFGALAAAVVAGVLFAPELPTIRDNWAVFNGRVNATLVLNQPLAPGQTRLGILAANARQMVQSYVLMDPKLGMGPYKGDYSWLDPVSAVFYLVGMGVAVARWRQMGLWLVLFLVPLVTTQVLTTVDGARAIAAITPMYVFAGLGLDLMLRLLGRAGVPGRLLGGCALLILSVVLVQYNVGRYTAWVNSAVAQGQRAPAVPVQDYPVWRDYQLALLHAHEGYVNGGTFVTLSWPAVVARIHQDPAFARRVYPRSP
jgi:4-amino-4-deoxy-L-arabinose transferase-like glycosyltransferase